jgi:hypothetical protein
VDHLATQSRIQGKTLALPVLADCAERAVVIDTKK